MLMYFNMLSGLSSLGFFVSILGLIYSLIKKKSKIPWILGIIGSFILISAIVLFTDEIIGRIDIPEAEIGDTSKDMAGAVRIKEGKYIVGEEIKEGVYDLTFQKDTGSFSLVNLYQFEDFMDSTAFGQNPKTRLHLNKGDGIDIQLGIAIFTPSTIQKLGYEKVEVTSGYWIVGETLAPGKYKVEDIKSPGNIRVLNSQGQPKLQEMLSEDITVDLAEGDVISISGTSISLVPTN